MRIKEKIQSNAVLSLTMVIILYSAVLTIIVALIPQSHWMMMAAGIIFAITASFVISLLFYKTYIKPLEGSGQKKEKSILLRNREQFLRFMDDIPLGVFIKDNQSRALYINNYMDKVFGRSNCMRKTPWNIFEKKIAERIVNEDARVLAGENIEVEGILTDKNGKDRIYMTHKFCLKDGERKLIGGISIEITLRREAEYKLRILSRAIRNSPVCVLITDSHGHIEYVNPAFVNASGYSFAEVMGENMNIINSGYHPESFFRDMWETISCGSDWQGEILNKRKDGIRQWEFVTISSIKNRNDEITHYVAIKDDISKRKQVEEALRNAKEKAEENDRLKSAFLANMSHEIRTPMNAIVGLSGLLSDPELSPGEKVTYSSVIKENSDHLLQLVDDIIDISKIEAGEISVRTSECSINELMTDIYNTFRLQAEEKKNIRFILNREAFASEIITVTDGRRLRQVITNLIGNALKFTEKGVVEFGCRLEKENEILFYVSDTGPGIPKNKHEIIFDRFRQVDDSYTKSYRGAGLGLSISKSLVHLLGGSIWVESEKGTGSCFLFTIPLKPASHFHEEADHVDEFPDQFILKKEDRENSI